MVAERDDPLPVEAVRDLLGVVRAMYAANKGIAHRRRALAIAGQELVEAINLANAHAPGTAEHRRAWELAESALVVVGTQTGRAEGLAPTLHTAIDRVRGRYTSGR
jgi:phage tail protein X